MITVTEQLKNVFEANPLYSKEGQGLNAEVIARFFLPFSSVVWLVTEAEQQEDGDWPFFRLLPYSRMGMGLCASFSNSRGECSWVDRAAG